MSDINFNSGTPTSNTPVTPAAATPANGDAPATPATPATPGDSHGFLTYNGRQLSQDEVLKKLEHADTFIETLKTERATDSERLAKLEEAMGKASKVEDVLKALQGGKEEPVPTDQPASAAPQSVEEITAAVMASLNAGKAQETAEGNWKTVTSTLTQAFGDQTNAKVAEIAAENDMTLVEAQDFAKSKPKAFLKLFGSTLQGSTSSIPLTPNSRNSGAPVHNPVAPSGYAGANSTRDQVAIYKAALAKHGL